MMMMLMMMAMLLVVLCLMMILCLRVEARQHRLSAHPAGPCVGVYVCCMGVCGNVNVTVCVCVCGYVCMCSGDSLPLPRELCVLDSVVCPGEA